MSVLCDLTCLISSFGSRSETEFFEVAINTGDDALNKHFNLVAIKFVQCNSESEFEITHRV